MARLGRDIDLPHFLEESWESPSPGPQLTGLYHPAGNVPAIERLPPRAAISGHPTAAGFPDPNPIAATRIGDPLGTVGGISMQRHIHPSPLGHGRGAPGNTPTGPFQPGVVYGDGRIE